MAREIKQIVIHCSATLNGKPYTVTDINQWHRTRGLNRDPSWMARQNPELDAIGYHFVIYTNGAVATGRHLDEIGAHVKGFNQKSLGVCMVGGINDQGDPTGEFTAAQWDSLAQNIIALKKLYPSARIIGHRDLSPDKNGDGKIQKTEWLKDCPCFDVSTWLSNNMKPSQKGIES